VSFGEALGIPMREKARVRPAVVAHGQGATAQEDDLHRVRMTALHAEHVMMVAPVRRADGARGHPGHLGPICYLLHDPPLLLSGGRSPTLVINAAISPFHQKPLESGYFVSYDPETITRDHCD
jgi:hypothetical protein